jgi:hypothetical protein
MPDHWRDETNPIARRRQTAVEAGRLGRRGAVRRIVGRHRGASVQATFRVVSGRPLRASESLQWLRGRWPVPEAIGRSARRACWLVAGSAVFHPPRLPGISARRRREDARRDPARNCATRTDDCPFGTRKPAMSDPRRYCLPNVLVEDD